MKKILITTFILVGIGGMWLLKNYDDLTPNNNVIEENINKQTEVENGVVEDKIIEEEIVVEKIEEPKTQSVTPESESIKSEIESVIPEAESIKSEIESVTPEVESIKPELEIESITPETESTKPELENVIPEDDVIDELPIIDLNDPNFELVASSLDLEVLKQYNLPILVDFGAEACIPCQMMYPTLVELNKELRGKAIIKFIDVWEYPEASAGFNFSLIPTQYFFDKEGNEYLGHTGVLSKENIIAVLKEMGMEE